MIRIPEPAATKRIPITFFTTLKGTTTMNQAELTIKVAQITGVPKRQVEDVLKTAGIVITAALVEEGEAVLPNLGRLVTQQKAARDARNPKTGETIPVPAHKAVKFRPTQALKDAVA